MIMNNKWFLEFRTPDAFEHCWESLSLAADLCRAFSRWVGGQNGMLHCVASRDGEVGIKYIALATDIDCSPIAHLTGRYRVMKRSDFRNNNRIYTHLAEVRVFQNHPRESLYLKSEKMPPRPGGGGGSPALLVVTDMQSMFSVTIENPKQGDTELASQIIQSRSYVSCDHTVMNCRLHPVVHFYCKLHLPTGEISLTEQEYAGFFDCLNVSQKNQSIIGVCRND